ncbi:hypothetical protein FKP32DRAFT_1594964 [Trametes sanguinea]|nr:hypothetical protein FKP32DRAFT_1594964 [Trametes sanguinea]
MLRGQTALVSTVTTYEPSLTDWTSATSQSLSREKDLGSTTTSQDVPPPSQPGWSDGGIPSVGLSPANWTHSFMPRRNAALRAQHLIASQIESALSLCGYEAADPEPPNPNQRKRRRTAAGRDDEDPDADPVPVASPKRRRILRHRDDGDGPTAQDATPSRSGLEYSDCPLPAIDLGSIRSRDAFDRPSDYKRYAHSQIHGPVLCSFCFQGQELAEQEDKKGKKSQKGKSGRARTLSRLPDEGYRHLQTCKKFKQSRYFKEKIQPRDSGSTDQLKRIAQDAVKTAHMMVVRLPCRNNPAYSARVALFEGIHPEGVEQHAAKYATVFKLDDCTCCPYPLYTAEAVQELGRRGASSGAESARPRSSRYRRLLH